MSQVCIIGAKRTAQGKFLGALARCSAVDLAIAAAKEAIGGVPLEKIDQVIIGNVLSAGSGMNVARQVSIRLGLPRQVPAFTVNMVCGSGMQAIALGAQAIRLGDADVILCGGTESMSNAPYLLDRARSGYKLGDGVLVDSLLRDGLTDAFSQTHMGKTAEAVAKKFNITRADQDDFAAESHRRYFAAAGAGEFRNEIVTVNGLATDEHARPDTSVEKLASLKPAFQPDGTVTAGNSSGIDDGAAVVLLCSDRAADKHNWQPLATIAGSTVVGCDPDLMGLGPIYATNRLCAQLNCTANDFDIVELNEAFAAQSLACVRELKLDHARTNPHGGAIAVGHPIGASGARLIVHLAHQVAQGKSSNALASLCIGGGMGIAMALRPFTPGPASSAVRR
jgi:acetyl-CoA C-acetyltransferase